MKYTAFFIFLLFILFGCTKEKEKTSKFISSSNWELIQEKIKDLVRYQQNISKMGSYDTSSYRFVKRMTDSILLDSLQELEEVLRCKDIFHFSVAYKNRDKEFIVVTKGNSKDIITLLTPHYEELVKSYTEVRNSSFGYTEVPVYFQSQGIDYGLVTARFISYPLDEGFGVIKIYYRRYIEGKESTSLGLD